MGYQGSSYSMRFRKLTLDSRGLFRKRHVHFNCEVSGWNDEFDCGGEAEVVGRMQDVLQDIENIVAGRPRKERVECIYGVSKKERKVSDHSALNILRGMVGFG